MSSTPESALLSPLFHTQESFQHIVTHVFFPVELPKKNGCTIENDLSLAGVVCTAAHAYTYRIRRTSEEGRWLRITKMLDNLRASWAFQSERLDKDHVTSRLGRMEIGDIFTLFVRHQNAAIILTKRENATLFESFEAPPSKDAVEKTPGSLICSYPWSAAEVSNEMFDDEDFQSALVHFLSLPSALNSDLPRPPPADPQYITGLLSGILRGVGLAADVTAISKRVRDNVGQWPRDPRKDADQGDWRRSTLWLLIRIAIQMSLERSSVGRIFYKQFTLYFICTIAGNRDNNMNLSNDLLHLISSKIFRRLNKLGSSAPDWLSEMALQTWTHLREILDARWNELSVRPSPFRNPSQEELIRDTKLSLRNSGEYIRKVISAPDTIRPRTPFDPNHRRRGTIEDFLSLDGSFFDEAYGADPDITVYDVERSVEQGIDDWIAQVVDVNDGCARLDMLMDQYCQKLEWQSPEHNSIKILTMLELFIALDKLVVEEIPMLADYPSGIPITWLEQLCLRKTMSLYRLSCAYQYLVARESRSHPGWSVVSDEFTEDSFPVRYYDQSLHLQQLKAHIEEEARDAECHCGNSDADAQFSGSPLPASLLHAKVVVFELKCPPCFRIWRSAITQIYRYPYSPLSDQSSPVDKGKCRLIVDVPELQHYLVKHPGEPHFVYFHPNGFQSQSTPTLRYLVPHELQQDSFRAWEPCSLYIGYQGGNLHQYVNSTTHTSNDILAEQTGCPNDLSLVEFIAFIHLRSGASLQWLNLLKGLRSRTLNLRREEVHFLLAQVVLQVGPLDPNTATWIWHQELQDMSFCNTFIDELDNLFVDGAGLIDGVFMSTISLLLARILASNPSPSISERVISLLRRVRRRTFRWVQELSYDLKMSPVNYERKYFLLRLAATCRSTFDVDCIALPQVIHTAEDVDAVLSCSFFMHALRLSLDEYGYLGILFDRDSRLARTLEEIVRNVVLADPSNRGVDLAIARVFVGYHPGTQRSESLRYPSSRWLTCHMNPIQSQPSQIVHINLLEGQIRLDGQPFGRLPREITEHRDYKMIFRNDVFFIVPSDLPGMDFMTLSITPNYKVHLSLRDDNLVVRAQCNQTNQVLQAIPSEILREDLPPVLIDDHIHWLDISSRVIEIRRRQQCWETSLENWRIDCGSGLYYAHKGHSLLVDTHSATWAMLSECFECLAFKHPVTDILMTTCSVDSVPRQQLAATLPRHALSFFVNDREELESCEFKNMVYDEDQCIGTLFGLKDLFVLRPMTHIAGISLPKALTARVALVSDGSLMEGKIIFNHRSYHTFKVDPELGCLVGNGDLKSMRFLAYLHAMTSFHRPDPLSNKMGTEAAYDTLLSAGCRSVMRVKALDEDRENGYTTGPWSSTRYPQLNAAHDEIQNRYYWTYYPQGNNPMARARTAWVLQWKRAARRAVHLFPSNTDRPKSLVGDKDLEHPIPSSNQDLDDIASVASSAVYHLSASTPTMDTISILSKIWKENVLVDPASKAGHHDGLEIWTDSIVRLGGLVNGVQDIHWQVENLKKEETCQRFLLLFLLPTLAYCSPSYQSAFLAMLIALASEANARLGNTPLSHANYVLWDGYRPTEQVIRSHIRSSCVSNESYDYIKESAIVNAAINHLLGAWPSGSPPTLSLPADPRVLDIERLTASLQQLFFSCYNNWTLKGQLIHILAIEHGLPTPQLIQLVSLPLCSSNQRTPSQVTLDQSLSDRLPPEMPQRSTLPRDGLQLEACKILKSVEAIPALNHLFSSLQTSSKLQDEYLALLESSASASKESLPTHWHTQVMKDNINELQRYYTKCRSDYVDAIDRLKKALSPKTDRERMLGKFSHWPSITADALLRCLASTSPVHLSEQWKKCLVSFAQLLLELQRARRLLRFALDGLNDEFSKELENEQCAGWKAEEYPDWLLIQIQGDFLIRQAQAEVAMQLMFPQSKGNTVMQVNMGEGKSSVIIPIAATALADGKQLVRVIVPKALTTQMFDILVARLGGLSNRPIYHLPFSRIADNNVSDVTEASASRKLMRQCMGERGILLVQPEHVLSLKLTCIEKQIRRGNTLVPSYSDFSKSIYQQIATRSSLTRGLSFEDGLVGGIFGWFGKSSNSSATTINSGSFLPCDDPIGWLDHQKWVHSHARDILDESDEILHPRFQLIYTVGFEQHMDGYSDRWTITQHILQLVRRHVYTLSRNHPNSVEYERGPPGSFPHIRIARASDVGQHLISMVVEDVMAGRLPNFDFREISSAALCGAIRSFISDKDVLQVSDTAKMVEEYAKHSHQNYLWNGLLLLRGLLASNILLFALSERRWRVDYGLFRDVLRDHRGYPINPRTMLAVPYRAKDVPALNTQFGHPDVTIILTCLSYYYAGLTEEQLRISFQILLDKDNPVMEYSHWIKDCESLPDSLRKLSNINPRSSEEWDKVTVLVFARNQAVIDFYLSQVVFLREAKEFPWKLCGSSWDLGEKRERLVTGFSGTSDSRWLLPMSVVQHDLDHQRGTSANVLARLLRQEQWKDSENYTVTHECGQRQTTREFLEFVAAQRPEIRVLLDVGAQILDLSNVKVAEAWLDIVRDAEAAVYFNENDELTVLPRNAEARPLSSSPFSRWLGKCVVYVDHPHTRGTDLKFPIGSRAAVTLGPKVTKDALIQGCMRMRMLGHGHIVMFFAPPGVDQSIRTVTCKHDQGIQVTISDVLSWTIRETWADIQHRAPNWAQQGIDHKARYDALSRFCNNEVDTKHLSDVWLQPNSKSLAELYAPHDTEDVQYDLSTVPGMRQQCKVLGILSLHSGHLEEEQEREVHREREREREVELPPRAEPADHFLHPDVVSFVKTGVIPVPHSGGAFLPVFTTLERSTAATRDADVWSPSILTTVDFSRTIKPESTKGSMDQYLRPVQWILSGKTDRGPVLVILSPFEADLLMPDITVSKHVHLHLYAPRTAERTKPSDDLKLYAIPPLPQDWTTPWELVDQLNVFAGQLYLRDYRSYLRLCRFLDLPTDESPRDTGKVKRNLFNIPGSFEEMEIRFSDSPLPTVMALLFIRNRGRPFDHTHMGKILQGQILTEKDFK